MHGIKVRMKRDEVLKKLRILKPRFADLNVRGMALFGSVARDEAGPESDIDIVVDLAGHRPFGLFEFYNLQQEIERQLGAPVDLTTFSELPPLVADRVAREKVDV